MDGLERQTPGGKSICRLTVSVNSKGFAAVGGKARVVRG